MIELSQEEKITIKNRQLKEYKVNIYVLSLQKIGLEAIGDYEGMNLLDERINALKKAYVAVEGAD